MCLHLPGSLRMSNRQHLDTHRSSSKRILERWQAAIDKGDPRPWLAATMRFHTVKRDKLVRILKQSPRHKHLLERVQHCGCQVNAYQDSAGEILVTANSCKSRFCPRCAQGSCRRSIQKTIARLPAFNLPRSFLTLTQPQHPGTSLATGIRAIRRAFALLRESDIWRNSVRGGAYVIELTASKTHEHTFHTHMHVIIECTWMDLEALTTEWKKAINKAHRTEYHITEDIEANRPDIRSCKDDESTIAYISAYLSRTIPDELYDHPVLLLDAIDSLGQHKRMASLFGDWQKTKPPEKPAAQPDGTAGATFQLLFGLHVAHTGAIYGDQLCLQQLQRIGLNYNRCQPEMIYPPPTLTAPPPPIPPPILFQSAA